MKIFAIILNVLLAIAGGVFLLCYGIGSRIEFIAVCLMILTPTFSLLVLARNMAWEKFSGIGVIDSVNVWLRSRWVMCVFLLFGILLGGILMSLRYSVTPITIDSSGYPHCYRLDRWTGATVHCDAHALK